MTVVAVLLAIALLLGSGPRSTRERAGGTVQGVTDTGENHRRRDPLADASALDVFAVCLESGMAVATAAAATALSAPPQLRAILQRAADLLSLGADPETAWCADTGEASLEALMRLARRSASSGSALAHGVRELAERSRQEAAHVASAAAERAGVLIAGPLGLCFLPAFVCLGIVPVVAGLTADVLRSGIL